MNCIKEEDVKMNVRKLAMCVVVLFAIMMGVPVIAGDASMDVVASAGLSCKTNLCDEIGQLAEKAFVAITRDRDYSAIRQFVSRVDALTGGGYQIDERAYEAFLDLLKRLIDFHSDDQEIRMCVYEAQKRLVLRMVPLGGDATRFLKRMRRMMAEGLKGYLKYLDDRIIPGFKLKPFSINVPPPIEAIEASTNVFIGFNVESVSDPHVRQLWERAIEENNKNAMLNREQSELSRMKEYYGAYVPFGGDCLRADYLNRDIDRSTQEEDRLSFYAILPIPNFLFQGRFDYSDTASFPIK